MKKNNFVFKIVSTLVIIFVLFIGNLMINAKLDDRLECYEYAADKIASAAGNAFILESICMYVPVNDGQDSLMIIYPETAFVEADINSEMKTLGIYSSPIYHGKVKINAHFNLKNSKNLSCVSEKAYIALSLPDSCLENHPCFTINGKSYDTIIENPAGYSSDVYLACNYPYTEGSLDFCTEIDIRGSDRFTVNALAENTTLKVTSDWASPGFADFNYLPEKYNITSGGFNAEWKVLFKNPDAGLSMGFVLKSGVDLYKKLDRAVNYSFLFVVVPFIVFFLFELLTEVKINPVQYLLSGASSVVFFLLLMALSEHISFGLSYLLASIGSGLLVSLYIASISGKLKFGFIMAGVFACLYSYLYISLMSEDYALLLGSLFAFIIIAVLMFFTRKQKSITISFNEDGNTKINSSNS